MLVPALAGDLRFALPHDEVVVALVSPPFEEHQERRNNCERCYDDALPTDANCVGEWRERVDEKSNPNTQRETTHPRFTLETETGSGPMKSFSADLSSHSSVVFVPPFPKGIGGMNPTSILGRSSLVL